MDLLPWCPTLAAGKMERDWNFGLFCFGLVTGARAKVHGMAEAAGAERGHWLILVRVYLLV
jgi:hypothetical protein